MKTIEQAAKEYANKTDKANQEWVQEDFKAGVEFTQRWISVEEVLPETEDMVLIAYENDTKNAVDTGYYSKKHADWGGRHYGNKITHWRPIEFK